MVLKYSVVSADFLHVAKMDNTASQ